MIKEYKLKIDLENGLGHICNKNNIIVGYIEPQAMKKILERQRNGLSKYDKKTLVKKYESINKDFLKKLHRMIEDYITDTKYDISMFKLKLKKYDI